MQSTLSAVLFLHGLVHVVGFIGPLELVSTAPFQTVVFGRAIPNRSPAARSLAAAWLLLALAFSVASVAVFVHASWWFPFTSLVLLASLAMCLSAWPGTRVGAALDVVLLLLCLLAERAPLWSDLVALLRSLPC